jgi:hypothetical protein
VGICGEVRMSFDAVKRCQIIKALQGLQRLDWLLRLTMRVDVERKN